jgi:hypothetical protein
MVGILSLWGALGLWQWLSQSDPQRVPLSHVSGPKPAVKSGNLEWAVNQPKPTPESPAMPKRNLFAPLSERQEQMMLAAAMPRSRKQAQPLKSMPAAPVAEQAVSIPVKHEPEPPLPVPPPQPPLSSQELAEIKERQEREQRIGKLKAQAAQYRLIGLSEGGGVKQAFVEKGSDIYVLKQGDTLDGVFMVSIIDLGGVKIRDAEFNVEYTMPIHKKEGS